MKCINALQSLAYQPFGGDRKTILHLYKAILWPIIKYCSFVYHGRVKNSQNKKIESIQNACIRTEMGALPDNNAKALLADAEMPMCKRDAYNNNNHPNSVNPKPPSSEMFPTNVQRAQENLCATPPSLQSAKVNLCKITAQHSKKCPMTSNKALLACAASPDRKPI